MQMDLITPLDTSQFRSQSQFGITTCIKMVKVKIAINCASKKIVDEFFKESKMNVCHIKYNKMD